MHPYLRTGLMTAAVALAAALAVVGFYAVDDDETTLPAEVERVVPVTGALIRPQDDVGVDLVDTHTGRLTINGEPVPFDQVTRVDALSQIFFRPGEGKIIRRFEPGTHRATVTYWPRQESEESAGSSFTWTFRVG